ncbi:MAG: FtsX-like permease family protein, partial [Planctomycetota bacterium]|nr:FtsX-like permease family protein [Planctomycetota bacterium]
DPNFVPTETRTLSSQISIVFLPVKLGAGMFDLFGLLALVLTAVGLYGVMSFVVGQRTREIGIRMAIGAQKRDVLRLVIRQGIKLTIIGIGIGTVLALFVTNVLSRVLYETNATDLVTYGGVALLLGGVSLLAIYIPARRAMKIDPMVALRYE